MLNTKKIDTFSVATFDSETEPEQVLQGGLRWNAAYEIAAKLWQSGNFYGVEIISDNPDIDDPIKWIRAKSKH